VWGIRVVLVGRSRRVVRVACGRAIPRAGWVRRARVARVLLGVSVVVVAVVGIGVVAVVRIPALAAARRTRRRVPLM
jgi:hypothetical protein